jgi:DNA helicase IV
VVYVGDLAQQTRLGTIRDWSAINETIPPERLIKLQKVYRNTKQILTYIRTRGYEVTIPEGIKEGEPVVEHHVESVEEQLDLLTQLVPADPNQTLGIICPTANYLQPFKAHFADDSRVRCLTFYEAQGVEFDTVAIVGWNETFFSTEHIVEGAREEVKRMHKDLLYVALTRAMEKLVIIKKV